MTTSPRVISYDKVLRRANELYEQAKGHQWDGCKAPEQRLQIPSDQVKCMLRALVEALNQESETTR